MIKDKIIFFVIIPVYKTEKYVHACIESVLQQTYQNFRIITVDDGSPDLAGKICDEYAAKDERITVIHQKNTGALAARVSAIRRVKKLADEASYIIFLDSDDTLKYNALRTIHDTIVSNCCDMVIYEMDRVINGEATKSSASNSYVGTIENKKELYRIVFCDSRYNSLCRKAVSVNLLSDNDYSKYYNVRLAEDLLQSIEFYKNCRKVVFINDRLYNYNLNPNSVTQTTTYENYNVCPVVRETVWEFLVGQNVWDDNEFDYYLGYLRKLLKNDIKIIAYFNIKREKIYVLYDQINNNKYYQIIINNANNKEILWLKKRMYTLLYYQFKFRRAIGKLLRNV